MTNEFLRDIFHYLPQSIIEKWAGQSSIYIPHAAVKIRRNEEIMQKFRNGADRRQLAKEYNISKWELVRIINRKSARKAYIPHIGVV